MQNNPSQICPKTFVPREKHFLEKSILCFRGGEKNAFLKSKILRYVQNLQWTWNSIFTIGKLFIQFIDKFLQLEVMEYLIHYV